MPGILQPTNIQNQAVAAEQRAMIKGGESDVANASFDEFSGGAGYRNFDDAGGQEDGFGGGGTDYEENWEEGYGEEGFDGFHDNKSCADSFACNNGVATHASVASPSNAPNVGGGLLSFGGQSGTDEVQVSESNVCSSSTKQHLLSSGKWTNTTQAPANDGFHFHCDSLGGGGGDDRKEVEIAPSKERFVEDANCDNTVEPLAERGLVTISIFTKNAPQLRPTITETLTTKSSKKAAEGEGTFSMDTFAENRAVSTLLQGQLALVHGAASARNVDELAANMASKDLQGPSMEAATDKDNVQLTACSLRGKEAPKLTSSGKKLQGNATQDYASALENVLGGRIDMPEQRQEAPTGPAPTKTNKLAGKPKAGLSSFPTDSPIASKAFSLDSQQRRLVLPLFAGDESSGQNTSGVIVAVSLGQDKTYDTVPSAETSFSRTPNSDARMVRQELGDILRTPNTCNKNSTQGSFVPGQLHPAPVPTSHVNGIKTAVAYLTRPPAQHAGGAGSIHELPTSLRRPTISVAGTAPTSQLAGKAPQQTSRPSLLRLTAIGENTSAKKRFSFSNARKSLRNLRKSHLNTCAAGVAMPNRTLAASGSNTENSDPTTKPIVMTNQGEARNSSALPTRGMNPITNISPTQLRVAGMKASGIAQHPYYPPKEFQTPVRVRPQPDAVGMPVNQSAMTHYAPLPLKEFDNPLNQPPGINSSADRPRPKQFHTLAPQEGPPYKRPFDSSRVVPGPKHETPKARHKLALVSQTSNLNPHNPQNLRAPAIVCDARRTSTLADGHHDDSLIETEKQGAREFTTVGHPANVTPGPTSVLKASRFIPAAPAGQDAAVAFSPFVMANERILPGERPRAVEDQYVELQSIIRDLTDFHGRGDIAFLDMKVSLVTAHAETVQDQTELVMMLGDLFELHAEFDSQVSEYHEFLGHFAE